MSDRLKIAGEDVADLLQRLSFLVYAAQKLILRYENACHALANGGDDPQQTLAHVALALGEAVPTPPVEGYRVWEVTKIVRNWRDMRQLGDEQPPPEYYLRLIEEIVGE